MEKLHTEHFGIQRKIVANMTSDSWESIPHVATIYKPDVTDFFSFLQSKKEDALWKGITFNTVMLKIIAEGLAACPAMNAHLKFNRRTVNGSITQYRDVNISVPMALPNGEMMTINIHNIESKNLRQLSDAVLDVRRRMENTNFTEAMFSVSMDNTLKLIRQGKFFTLGGRFLGLATAKTKLGRIKGKARRAYAEVPETDRLTKKDIEQGTILVSNLGSVYRGSYLDPALLEVIPPQVFAFGIGAVQDAPGIQTNADGSREVAIRKFLPFSLCMDHRALDFGDIVPFLKVLDQFFLEPKRLEALL